MDVSVPYGLYSGALLVPLSFLLHFSFMSQATGYSASVNFVPVRFATPVVFPPLHRPFKHQRPLSRNDQTESPHSSVSGAPGTRSAHTATTTKLEPMTRKYLVVDPPATGRVSSSRPRPNTASFGDVQPTSEPSTKKSHARKQPEGHIPRPRNAFILFRCHFVAQKKIPASVEPDHRNISRIVGRIWKAMSDEDRRPWVEEAKRERETHKRLYPQYRYSPSSTATSTTRTRLKTKRAQNKKTRERMGVLPTWEVEHQNPGSALQAGYVPCAHPSEPIPQQPRRREEPQYEAPLQPYAQTFVSDRSWSTLTIPNSGDEGAIHALFGDQLLSIADREAPPRQCWESPCAEPRHYASGHGVAIPSGSFPVRFFLFPRVIVYPTHVALDP